jgi:putative ABC transport system substrate-binding protein
MRRREFFTLLGGVAAAPIVWPLAAQAQQPRRMPTIGYLGPGTPSTDSALIAVFVQRLRELGWIEDRTVAIEVRWAAGSSERATEIAAEFVRNKVDVIVASGFAHISAAQQATTGHPYRVPGIRRPGCNRSGLFLGATRRECHRTVRAGDRPCRQTN